MTQQELIAKQRRISEIKEAALANVATADMIKELIALKKEIDDYRQKSIDEYSEELLKKWGVAADAPAGTKCEAY
jgi:hypothetical protein